MTGHVMLLMARIGLCVVSLGCLALTARGGWYGGHALVGAGSNSGSVIGSIDLFFVGLLPLMPFVISELWRGSNRITSGALATLWCGVGLYCWAHLVVALMAGFASDKPSLTSTIAVMPVIHVGMILGYALLVVSLGSLGLFFALQRSDRWPQTVATVAAPESAAAAEFIPIKPAAMLQEAVPAGGLALKFLAEETTRVTGATSLSAATLYTHYSAWCRARGAEPLTTNALGQIIASLGVKKKLRQGRVHYQGLLVKSSSEVTPSHQTRIAA